MIDTIYALYSIILCFLLFSIITNSINAQAYLISIKLKSMNIVFGATQSCIVITAINECINTNEIRNNEN